MSEMKSSLNKKIIFDFFNGNHTSIQKKMIEEWLEDPENEELYYKYFDEWESLNPQYLVDKEKGLKSVYEKLAQKETVDFVKIEPDKKIYHFKKLFSWVAAASIVFLLGWFGWVNFSKPKMISYENLVSNSKKEAGEIYEKENLTSSRLLITLPDGSSVILQPSTKISYSPKAFNQEKREIFLSGEAFFEVQKNPEIPFIVYANELITKVLGTSFTIKANPNSLKTEVIVKTGKVEVFMQSDVNKDQKINHKKLSGLILIPNEQASLLRADERIEKTVLSKIEQIYLPIHQLSFDFEEAPAIEVIEVLKNAYNIDIVYDHEKLANCTLTAHLSDEPLYEKIKLICFALEATYEESEGKIFIKCNGCK
jgi:transmembrane sensor